MNFLALQNATMLSRFKEGQRSVVKDWLNYEWGKVWDGFDWEWKKVGPTNVAVTAGSRTPAVPSDFALVLELINESGEPLTPLSPDAFDDLYLSVTQTGTPEAFKVVASQIYLGPTPNATVTYTLAYERRVGYHAAGVLSNFTQGSMSLDTDIPAYLPAEHHYYLALRAARLGMRLEQDPSWIQLVDEISEAEQFMVNALMPDPGGENLQYGRDTLGLR